MPSYIYIFYTWNKLCWCTADWHKRTRRKVRICRTIIILCVGNQKRYKFMGDQFLVNGIPLSIIRKNVHAVDGCGDNFIWFIPAWLSLQLRAFRRWFIVVWKSLANQATSHTFDLTVSFFTKQPNLFNWRRKTEFCNRKITHMWPYVLCGAFVWSHTK